MHEQQPQPLDHAATCLLSLGTAKNSLHLSGQDSRPTDALKGIKEWNGWIILGEYVGGDS